MEHQLISNNATGEMLGAEIFPPKNSNFEDRNYGPSYWRKLFKGKAYLSFSVTGI